MNDENWKGDGKRQGIWFFVFSLRWEIVTIVFVHVMHHKACDEIFSFDDFCCGCGCGWREGGYREWKNGYMDNMEGFIFDWGWGWNNCTDSQRWIMELNWMNIHFWLARSKRDGLPDEQERKVPTERTPLSQSLSLLFAFKWVFSLLQWIRHKKKRKAQERKSWVFPWFMFFLCHSIYEVWKSRITIIQGVCPFLLLLNNTKKPTTRQSNKFGHEMWTCFVFESDSYPCMLCPSISFNNRRKLMKLDPVCRLHNWLRITLTFIKISFRVKLFMMGCFY